MSKSIQFRMRYHKSTETLTLMALNEHVPYGNVTKISCSSSMKNIVKNVSDWVRVTFPEVGEHFINFELKEHSNVSCKNITLDADFTFNNHNKRITLIGVDVFGQTPIHHHTVEMSSGITPLMMLVQYILKG